MFFLELHPLFSSLGPSGLTVLLVLSSFCDVESTALWSRSQRHAPCGRTTNIFRSLRFYSYETQTVFCVMINDSTSPSSAQQSSVFPRPLPHSTKITVARLSQSAQKLCN